MDKNQAYELFSLMIDEAKSQLRDFTLHFPLTVNKKADKSVVTLCDKVIDKRLTQIAQKNGLQTISEEGIASDEIAKTGNYLTIDPIDGTLGYIEYVNNALRENNLERAFTKDLGPESDFCLLLGIVQNNSPRFAACYNYITQETILIDARSKPNLKRFNNVRNYAQQYAVYLDQRPTDDAITKKLLETPNISIIKQATLGLKSLYTILNPHRAAVTVHLVQTAGLWDVLPAAVACRAFGGNVYDGLVNELKFNSYVILPGNGAIVIKGEKFQFVLSLLRQAS